MCRLYGFLSNEPTKVDCSLVFAQNALMLQSRIDLTGRDHADGWGIATYTNGTPSVQKKTTAAYADQHFSATAEKAYSTAIVAHVRRATVGVNSIANTHPFVHGSWTFAHNGTVTGFDEVGPIMQAETREDLQSIRQGQTDSEQYFLWLLSRLAEHGYTDENLSGDDKDEVTELLMKSVSRVADWCESSKSDEDPRLNFVLTNGKILIACRWNNTLHMIQREGIYDCEICGIPHIHHHESVNHRAVAIASEPVTHEQWQEVENRSIVMVDQRICVAA